MTHWRVTWEYRNGGDCWERIFADIPGGEFGMHGAREYAAGLVSENRRKIQVKKSEDGIEWVEAPAQE